MPRVFLAHSKFDRQWTVQLAEHLELASTIETFVDVEDLERGAELDGMRDAPAWATASSAARISPRPRCSQGGGAETNWLSWAGWVKVTISTTRKRVHHVLKPLGVTGNYCI